MTPATGPSQYLTFKLDQGLYAIEIAKVREVLEFTTVTKLPHRHDFTRGIINVRGKVVPIIDMRLILGMTQTTGTIDTCVIITEVEVDGEKTVLGILTDAVQEVIDLDSEQILPPPHMGTQIETDIIRGLGKRDDHFLIILDIDRVFSVTDLHTVTGQTISEIQDQLPTSSGITSP